MAADYRYLQLDQDLNPFTETQGPGFTNTSLDSLMEDGGLGSSKVQSIVASKIKTGTLQANQSIFIGESALELNGSDRQIKVKDSNGYVAILIGKAVGFF